ncbi:MAG: hypothetical protein ABL994_04280 [Verrucomicrobiales bacterium]
MNEKPDPIICDKDGDWVASFCRIFGVLSLIGGSLMFFSGIGGFTDVFLSLAAAVILFVLAHITDRLHEIRSQLGHLENQSGGHSESKPDSVNPSDRNLIAHRSRQ